MTYNLMSSLPHLVAPPLSFLSFRLQVGLVWASADLYLSIWWLSDPWLFSCRLHKLPVALAHHFTLFCQQSDDVFVTFGG